MATNYIHLLYRKGNNEQFNDIPSGWRSISLPLQYQNTRTPFLTRKKKLILNSIRERESSNVRLQKIASHWNATSEKLLLVCSLRSFGCGFRQLRPNSASAPTTLYSPHFFKDTPYYYFYYHHPPQLSSFSPSFLSLSLFHSSHSAPLSLSLCISDIVAVSFAIDFSRISLNIIITSMPAICLVG